MTTQVINTKAAPAAIGPYVQGVQVGNMVYFSGQLGIDPATGALVEGGVRAQAGQALKNIAALLAAVGANSRNIVKSTIFLVDMADFAVVNEVYAGFFEGGFPARSCVAVRQLPLRGLVEMEVIVAL